MRRLRAFDPLLPASHPLPEPLPGDVRLRAPGGEAVYRRHRPDPEAFEACWNALDQHQLHARVAPDADADHPAALDALDALLTAWERRIAAAPPGGAGGGTGDAEAVITWPSRDTAAVRVLLAHGLTPKTIAAARPATAHGPSPRHAVPIRPLTLADAGAAARLWLEELRWEAQFGSAWVREAAERNIRQRLAEALARDRPWVWLAGEPGRAASGMIAVEPPEPAAVWARALTSARRPGYITHMVVTAAHRGAGVGTALAHTAHTALSEAGCTLTLLHYAALNPLSGPFWHRHAYRPLWTTWHRRL
ncbi:GNAT family N-acetyltransferase [Streptomyces sp. 6N223]|uniref:GNAT family N-acetyltransferase n=1 Tax=Streptomyces sp. 6N223 TaxID=3457412 RepID=UPI003FD5E772